MTQMMFLHLATLLCTLSIVECKFQSYEQAQQQWQGAEQLWFLELVEIGDFTLPISWTTVIVSILSVLYIVINFARREACYFVASHIVLRDPGPASREKLKEWKKTIGRDSGRFAKYATDHSECPSKQNFGRLGRVERGKMDPHIDRICFDPNSPLKTALGPVQSSYGWHLVYIEDRKLRST